MIDDLRALAVFAKTVELGSFRAAAQALELSPSVVSHHVARLEAKLQTPLLYRSTRHLSLTKAGEQLVQSAQQMLRAAETGIAQVAQFSQEPQGHLTVAVPAILMASPLGAALATFGQKYPAIGLSINVSDHRQNLIKAGIDVAIRIGDLPDSALVARSLCQLTRVLTCHRDYLEQLGSVDHPFHLEKADWIGVSMRPDFKVLHHPKGEQVRLDYQARIHADQVAAVYELTRHGFGLSTPPRFLAQGDLDQGRMVELCPPWQVEPLPVFAIWPGHNQASTLRQRLIDHLSSLLGDRI